MTIEQLLEFPTKDLEALTDAELLAYFEPYLEVSRPKVKEKKEDTEEESSSTSSTIITLSPGGSYTSGSNHHGAKRIRQASKPKLTAEQQVIEMMKKQDEMFKALGISREDLELPKGMK